MNKILLSALLILYTSFLFSQEKKKNYGEIHGNLQTDMQTYKEDSLIRAPAVKEKMRLNSYANIIYTRGDFSAGVRYEAYYNTLLGYDERYNGHGIGYRYASYKAGELEVTVGNFYEQFGSGLILRAYEEKTLGIDNALDGLRLKYRPVKGITLTGIVGKQKKYFDYGAGIVRGIDGEISINDLSEKLSDKKTKIIVGGSFVSKYQENSDPVYNFPENVGAYAGRFSISRGKINITSEYAHKFNDPSYDNEFIFKDGQAISTNISYSQKGLGILVGLMSLDNMSFRSERSATINDVNINYLPTITKTHTYSLAAMYPFSSQPNGQIGLNTEIFYKLKRKTLLGGKYGTNISINFSQVNAIKKDKILVNPDDEIPNLDGYESPLFSMDKQVYFRDINIEIHKKISKKYKLSLIYMNQEYDKDQIQGLSGYGVVKANIGIADMTYKISSKHALRMETEILLTKQDYGDWAMLLLEYTYSPHWFVAVYDQYNYGNPDDVHKVHYFNLTTGYTKGSNRFQIAYGKQREGIMCVGGVCRNVPASNGFTFSVTSTF